MLRNKAVLTLMILLVLAMVIGTLQNHYAATGQSWFLQDTISAIVSPISRAAHAVGGFFSGIGGFFTSRATLASSNATLRQRVQDLSLENNMLREQARENESLRQELQFKTSQPLKMTPAEVISRSESSWFSTVTIDIGGTSGVQKGSAVFNHQGLVGQVEEVNPYSSQVISIKDRSSGVGGVVQRSRSTGIVQGQGNDDLVFTYLPKDADIQVGDVVVSSSMGKVIPEGLPIGKVIEVIRDNTAGTTTARLKPSVPFDQVEHVFVAEVGEGVKQ